MAGFSILAASEPRQRFVKLSSETCCLRTIAAVTTHTQQELQALMDRFSQACKDFGQTISLKKTNVLGQDTMELPTITIDDHEPDVVEQFAHLGSTITDNLSLDTKIFMRLGKAATTLACLTSLVWTNPKLTVKTKMVVYNACVVSTLMYGSKTWTTYARQEKTLNSFPMCACMKYMTTLCSFFCFPAGRQSCLLYG